MKNTFGKFKPKFFTYIGGHWIRDSYFKEDNSDYNERTQLFQDWNLKKNLLFFWVVILIKIVRLTVLLGCTIMFFEASSSPLSDFFDWVITFN
jgi:hypothetical protein